MPRSSWTCRCSPQAGHAVRDAEGPLYRHRLELSRAARSYRRAMARVYRLTAADLAAVVRTTGAEGNRMTRRGEPLLGELQCENHASSHVLDPRTRR